MMPRRSVHMATASRRGSCKPLASQPSPLARTGFLIASIHRQAGLADLANAIAVVAQLLALEAQHLPD